MVLAKPKKSAGSENDNLVLTLVLPEDVVKRHRDVYPAVTFR